MSADTTVKEIIDGFPSQTDTFEVQRQEDLLLTRPDPGNLKLWSDPELLKVIHLPTKYIPADFAPPKDVYGNDFLRLEWQQMNNRQPFYHRNADVDEISYQVTGTRTLSTEVGVLQLDPGDYTRIPVSVAHDNLGKEEVHILFYVHGPTVESGPVDRVAQAKLPPFEGWEGQIVVEMLTECLGKPHCTIAVSQTDETVLLNRAKLENQEVMTAIRASAPGVCTGTEWMYQTKHVWIGHVRLNGADGKVYHRHRQADEIQYQVSGTRTLVSQHGVVELEPGDFVCIPRGCAFTSIARAESVHICTLSSQEALIEAKASKVAKQCSSALLAEVRKHQS
jgi:uncharacterized cupin superfamily protein